MLSIPHEEETLRAHRSPAEGGTVDHVPVAQADWPMKRFSFAMDPFVRRASACLCLLLAFLMILGTVLLVSGGEVFFARRSSLGEEDNPEGVAAEKGEHPYADGVSGNVKLPWAEKVTIIPADKIDASHAVLADLSTGSIIASRKADEPIFPASMTKIMTLIVVVENLPREDCLQDEILISTDVYNRMKEAGSSGIGLEAGERLRVESLLYALILESDGIAACELARYVAGTEEDFVELMNQKAEKMGLEHTHFENPTGLHHPNHRSTAREIASIMAYAMNMKLCRKVMLTKSINAPCIGSNGRLFHYFCKHKLTERLFNEIPAHQPQTLEVLTGKTGYTDESGFCLVTYGEDKDGRGYVCVTAKGKSYASCISDYRAIYDQYVGS